MVHHPVMPDLVFLQCLGIQDSNLEVPHAGDGVKNYLIPPEVFPEKTSQVLFEGQWWVPAPRRISLLHPIERHKSNELVFIDEAVMIHHVVYNLSPKISVGEVRSISPSTGIVSHRQIF